MKALTDIIESNEDSYFAYVKQIDGCVAGGSTYTEVKENLEEMINLILNDDKNLKHYYPEGYNLKFEGVLQSVFDLLTEVNISNLLNWGISTRKLLRQYFLCSKRHQRFSPNV